MAREVLVRGQGEASAMPDHAAVQVTVEADGDSQQDAYSQAAEIAAAVDAVLAAHSAAVSRTTTTSLVVHPRTRWKKGEEVRTGWRATRTSAVEVTDFGQLGVLMAELVDAGAAVAGVSWELSLSNPVHDEARQQAARQARAKAEAYAAALGLTLGPVAWIAEPGMRLRSDGPVAASGFVLRSAAHALADEPIDVSPGEITVQAAVEVGFELL
ncbi:MAG TPA: SIMPL domain-containing protein [Streptosporangiaceae bacterium]